jgi:hypothetical protein
MRVRIPGSGLMGGKLGAIFTGAESEIVFGYPRTLNGMRAVDEATRS